MEQSSSLDILWSILVAIITIAVLAIAGMPLLKRYNSRKPDVQRRWTDPKEHDRLDKRNQK